MGADLYINSVQKKLEKKYNPLFEKWVAKRKEAKDEVEEKKCQEKVTEYYNKMFADGYYRDSYNSSNLLWQYGLDYWGWFSKLLNKDGELEPMKAKIILMTLDDGINDFEENLSKLSKDNQKYFAKKDKEFRKFLQTAIEMDEPIYCSI